MDISKQISDGLIKLRKERGITQKELAELSGLKQPVISRYERDGISSIRTLEKVLKVLLPKNGTFCIKRG